MLLDIGSVDESQGPVKKAKLDESKEGESEGLRRYDRVVIGGTFDHIHTGHKILVGIAALLARKQLVTGLSSKYSISASLLSSFDDTTPFTLLFAF